MGALGALGAAPNDDLRESANEVMSDRAASSVTATDAATDAATDVASGLRYTWSAIYMPAWDGDPGAYVAHEVVEWGRSRRLAKVVGAVGQGAVGQGAFKAYLGVQHSDPGRWGVAGEPRAVFFLSLFLNGRTLSLRTYPTLGQAGAALTAAYARILALP